jgi:hypothetical protein
MTPQVFLAIAYTKTIFIENCINYRMMAVLKKADFGPIIILTSPNLI